MRTHSCSKCHRYFETIDFDATLCEDCDENKKFDVMEIYTYNNKYYGKVSPVHWVDLKLHKFLWFYYFTKASHKYMVFDEQGFKRVCRYKRVF